LASLFLFSLPSSQIPCVWFLYPLRFSPLIVGEQLGHSLNWCLSTWWSGVVGLGSTGRLFALVLPQMTRSAPKVKPPWAHVRAKRRTTFESRLLSMMECCIARDSPHQMGEVNSFLYVTIGLYMIIVNTLPSIAKNLSEAILFIEWAERPSFDIFLYLFIFPVWNSCPSFFLFRVWKNQCQTR